MSPNSLIEFGDIWYLKALFPQDVRVLFLKMF